MTSLTQGAVSRLVCMEGNDSGGEFQPIVQIINIKPVGVGSSNERNRVILSDGKHYCQGMLATQLNGLVTSGELTNNCILKIEECMNNKVQNRTVIIVLKVQLLNENPGSRIGNPVDMEKAGGAAPTTAAQQAQPLYNSTNSNTGGSADVKPKPYNATNSYSNSNPYGGGGGAAARPSSGNNPYGGHSSQSHQAPIVRTDPVSGITPISQLNMYNNRWTLLARVTSKSDVRTWSNSKGEGSLFSIELLDSSGTDIRATFFKEAVDKFNPVIEEGKVYRLTGGRLKVANAQWNTCKSSFEITFDQNAEIYLENDAGQIQQQNYEFRKIADLESTEANSFVDIIAVVKNVGEPATIISKKNGKELTKCDLTLADESGTEVTCTLWGDKAQSAPSVYAGQPIAAFRRLRVSDYGGKSCSASGAITIDPDVPEKQALQSWWQQSGSMGAATVRSLSSSGGAGRMESLNERKCISAIKKEGLGYQQDKPDWLSFRATVSFIKKDKEGGAWYPACANSGEPCKNRFKVNQTTDGKWQCDKCQGIYDSCVRRWIFSAVLEDDSASTWVSFFNEQAESLLSGSTADNVYDETYSNPEGENQDAYDSHFARANFSEWIFKCKVKNEMVNDESRVKTAVYSMHPVDYAKDSLEMLAAIEKF